MKSLRFSALVVFVVLGACSGAPTVAEPVAPSFDALAADGGNMIGSGKFYDDHGGHRTGSETAQSVQSDTTERGGSSLGSGN